MKETDLKVEACMSCLSEDVTVYANGGWIGVECNDCPAQVRPNYRSAEEAVEKWNSFGRPRGYQRKYPTPAKDGTP